VYPIADKRFGKFCCSTTVINVATFIIAFNIMQESEMLNHFDICTRLLCDQATVH
jgi:hypothetical protein